LSFKEDKTVEFSSGEEKRQHPRFPVRLAVDLWQTPDVVLGGVVTDMSEVGLGLRSIHEIQISADLGIRVYLSRGEFSFDSIEGTGRIIWRTAHQEQGRKGYRYGMYILKMASYSRDRLMKYIQMLQEEESSSH
jgi:PilZ domain